MKKVLFFVIMLAAASYADCQELLFKVNQSGLAYKNGKTGKFGDAEINDIEATIFLQNNRVLLDGSSRATYILDKKGAQTKVHENIISDSYDGKDDNNAPISFIYTVNLTSKEAVVEVVTKQLTTFYFGSYSSSDFTSLH